MLPSFSSFYWYSNLKTINFCALRGVLIEKQLQQNRHASKNQYFQQSQQISNKTKSKNSRELQHCKRFESSATLFFLTNQFHQKYFFEIDFSCNIYSFTRLSRVILECITHFKILNFFTNRSIPYLCNFSQRHIYFLVFPYYVNLQYEIKIEKER